MLVYHFYTKVDAFMWQEVEGGMIEMFAERNNGNGFIISIEGGNYSLTRMPNLEIKKDGEHSFFHLRYIEVPEGGANLFIDARCDTEDLMGNLAQWFSDGEDWPWIGMDNAMTELGVGISPVSKKETEDAYRGGPLNDDD